VSSTPTPQWPAYRAVEAGELQERTAMAVSRLSACDLCPRDCGVDRLSDKWSACKTGRHAVVSSYFAHFGEEDCLRGWRGSGTIFFVHCNLRCVFCQNWEISQAVKPAAGRGAPAARIAGMMLELQARGCHNINLVTPEHVVPQVLESLSIAIGDGLRLPLVYNTSGYDSTESVELMDGIVDIYMPDFKLWTEDLCHRYLKASDYAAAARRAIKTMHDQVGPLRIGADGLAERGLLVRHLVMPGLIDETRSILEWLATELGPGTYLNLMDQYRPSGRVGGGSYPEIDRRTPSAEYAEAQRMALDLGLRLDTRRPA
jgi:putative pyruvate formate lyase activating enzyme